MNMQTRPIIDSKAEDITEYVKRLERIESLAKHLYLAGHWRCPELSEDEQDSPWRLLREELGVSYTRDVLGGKKE